MKKSTIAWIQVVAVATFIIVGFMVAEGAWLLPENPSNPSPGGGVNPFLHTGPLGQNKGGGIRINAAPGTDPQLGLIVYGDDALGVGNTGTNKCGINSRDGCVFIGSNSFPERLSVDGDFKIGGLLAVPTVADPTSPNPTTGAEKQVLAATQNGNGMAWTQDFAWLTIQRIDIHEPGGSCVAYFPRCPFSSAEPWTKYGEYGDDLTAACTTPGAPFWRYRDAYRVCVKPIP